MVQLVEDPATQEYDAFQIYTQDRRVHFVYGFQGGVLARHFYTVADKAWRPLMPLFPSRPPPPVPVVAPPLPPPPAPVAFFVPPDPVFAMQHAEVARAEKAEAYKNNPFAVEPQPQAQPQPRPPPQQLYPNLRQEAQLQQKTSGPQFSNPYAK